jgi:uncharacterized paraquat-inducible protein A
LAKEEVIRTARTSIKEVESGMISGGSHFLAAVVINGSVAVPILWILIVILIFIGSALYKGGSKGLGSLMMIIGVILLLGTSFGQHVKAALNSLLHG